jgi:hypothetical protein
VVNNPYPLPNDELEHLRLDQQHQVFKTSFGGNVLVPISQEETGILECGSGSGASPNDSVLILGRWAIEVAEEFPKAWVIGMDISPIHPKVVPPNCEFIIGDLTKYLDQFGDGSIDIFHSRYVNYHACP